MLDTLINKFWIKILIKSKLMRRIRFYSKDELFNESGRLCKISIFISSLRVKIKIILFKNDKKVIKIMFAITVAFNIIYKVIAML